MDLGANLEKAHAARRGTVLKGKAKKKYDEWVQFPVRGEA